MNFNNCNAKDDLGNIIGGNTVCENGCITLSIPFERIDNNANFLCAFEDVFEATVGDEGFYLGSHDFGRFSGFKTRFIEREDFSKSVGINLVNMFGVKIGDFAYTAIISGMPYVYMLQISKTGNKYHIGLGYDLSKLKIDEDIELKLFKMNDADDYIEMAKLFRRYQLENNNCKLIAEKSKSRDILHYINKSVEIRIRMGWKPCPPEILEQTVDNEPPMHVACSFKRVMNIIDEMEAQGIEDAQICLVGWNKSGHDGRWPTTFPVEERLGGERDLKQLTEHAKNNGYTIVGHSNSTDCYNISDEFNNGEITIKNKKGEPVKNRVPWSGGNMYWLCPKVAVDFSKKMMDKMKDIGFYGMHYIDVISLNQPRQCFDENHPSTIKETIDIINEIMQYSKDKFGGFSSEGAFDYCAKHLDYALYVCYDRPTEVYMDEGVPLWEMIYHGIINRNPSKGTINYTEAEKAKKLQMVEMCGRPTFYYYSKFTNKGEWDGKDVFTADTDEDIIRTVSSIKKATEDYKKYNYLQEIEMINYKKLSGDSVTQVVYADGTNVFVNYSDKDYADNYITIKAKDFVILKNN